MKRKKNDVQQRSFTNWVMQLRQLLTFRATFLFWSNFFTVVPRESPFRVLSTTLSRNAFYSGTPLIRPPLGHENRELSTDVFTTRKATRRRMQLVLARFDLNQSVRNLFFSHFELIATDEKSVTSNSEKNIQLPADVRVSKTPS